jgi:hypothetical protein
LLERILLTIILHLPKRQGHKVCFGMLSLVAFNGLGISRACISDCGMLKGLSDFRVVDGSRWSFLGWVHQSVAVLIIELPVDLDVGIQAHDASRSVEMVHWHSPFIEFAVLQVGQIALGIDKVEVVLTPGNYLASNFVAWELAVSVYRSPIAVAIFTVPTVVLNVVSGLWAVAVDPTGAISLRFLHTMVAQS